MTDKDLKNYAMYLKAYQNRLDEIDTLKRKIASSSDTAEHMFGLTNVLLLRQKQRLEECKKEAAEYGEKVDEIEEYIRNIKNKEIKAIASFRAYDGMSWTEIAASIGKPADRTTYSKRLNNYLKEH